MEKQGFLDKEKLLIHFVKDAGILFAFALAMLLISIFTVAYYSPTKTVTVAINMFGEADFEFYLIWIIVMPTIVTGYWLVYQKEITPDARKYKNKLSNLTKQGDSSIIHQENLK